MAKSFKQMILNEIEKQPRGYTEVLAKISGYSSSSALMKVIKDSKKEFEKFNGLIELVNYIWPDDSVNMMVIYSKEVDPNKKSARNFLEYLSINKKWPNFLELVEKMDNSTNKESQEWVKVYKYLYKYEIAAESQMSNLLREVNQMIVNSYELKVLLKMLSNYLYSQMNDYSMVKILSKEIDKEVEVIENDFIKEMYMIRTNQIMSYNHLRVFNNPDKAIQCSDNIINSNAPTCFKAYAYFIKGYSHLFTSFEKSIENLQQSLKLYREDNREENIKLVKVKIEFVQVYWDKFSTGDKCENIDNQLLLNIKKGKDVSEELTTNKENIYPEFHYFLSGLNSNSNKQLKLSLIKYMKKNDLFLANLAKIELIKNGEDEEILNELFN